MAGDEQKISERFPEPLSERDSFHRDPAESAKHFSDIGRENREGIDPDSGEVVALLTRKQFTALRVKELKAF